MRDRLIELLNKKYDHFCDQCGVNKDSRYTHNLAGYLLKNGVIVPPCKVGDTVYMIYNIPLVRGVVELTVENIVIGINPSKCNLYCKHESGSKDMFYKESFGKVLFFTKEEAENALKERERG